MTLFQKKLIFFEPFIYLFAWPFHHCFFTLSTEDKIHASIQASGYWSSIKSNKMRKKTYWIPYFYTASTLKGFNWMFWKHVSAIICSLTWLTAHSLSETSFRFSILIYSLWQNSYRLPAFFSLFVWFLLTPEPVHYSGLTLHLFIWFHCPTVAKIQLYSSFLTQREVVFRKAACSSFFL